MTIFRHVNLQTCNFTRTPEGYRKVNRHPLSSRPHSSCVKLRNVHFACTPEGYRKGARIMLRESQNRIATLPARRKDTGRILGGYRKDTGRVPEFC